MFWKGKELLTMGDMSDAVAKIVSEGTRHEAETFMTAYRAESVHAAANVGYLSGYFGRETRQKICDWFQVAHPIFGTYEPTPEEAFDAGKRIVEDR